MVGRFTVSISPISRTAWAPWAPLTQVGTCAPSLVQPSRSSRRYQPESSGSTRRGGHRSRSPASCKPKPRPTRGPPEEEGLRTTLGSSPQPFPHTPSTSTILKLHAPRCTTPLGPDQKHHPPGRGILSGGREAKRWWRGSASANRTVGLRQSRRPLERANTGTRVKLLARSY